MRATRWGGLVSTGGFHNAMVYPALNTLAAAWADLTVLAVRHVTALRTLGPAGGGGRPRSRR